MRYRKKHLILISALAFVIRFAAFAQDPAPVNIEPKYLLGQEFKEPQPKSLTEWEARATKIRQTLWDLLGFDKSPSQPQWARDAVIRSRQTLKTRFTTYDLYGFTFINDFGETVPGVLLVPAGDSAQKRPAVLYNHYHGAAWAIGKSELINGDSGWMFGSRFVNEGYIVMAIDSPGHGERMELRLRPLIDGQTQRKLETPQQAQDRRVVELAWYGQNVLGRRTYDDILALNLLASHPQVDSTRIGTMGMSMGSSRTDWLLALSPRKLACGVSVATIPRMQDLIMTDATLWTGPLHFPPGMLKAQLDMEAVFALGAPTPRIFLVGDEDRGSPVSGVRKIDELARSIYQLYGVSDEYKGILMRGESHAYPDWAVNLTVQWMNHCLKGAATPKSPGLNVSTVLGAN